MRKQAWTLALTSVVGAAALLSGCSGGAEQNGADAGKDAGPTQISVMTVFFTPEPPGEDDVTKKEIEKNTNTKLNISWVSGNNYDDKMNVTLASGDIPELMLVLDPYHPQVQTMAAQGAFWDLTPYIKDYKHLSELPALSWQNSSINGRSYGIPRVRPLEGSGSFPLIRKDWLDKLGLPVPADMDQMYETMKAFKEKDPDGNGKNDTIGFSGLVSSDGMGSFGWVENVFNGTNGRWKEKDGKLLNTVYEPGTREALVWLTKAYQDGIIAPDFPTLKTTQVRDLITTSKAGIFADAIKPSWLLTGQMRKTNPQADLLPLTYLEGPNGKFVPKDSGVYGMYVIPTTVPEAKMKKLLQFMDYGATEEGWMLASFGLKDVHYTVKDGVIAPTEQAAKDNVGVFLHLFANLDRYERAYQTGIPADFLNRNKQIIDERAKYSVADPAVGLNSETYLKIGKDYDKKIQDLKVKIILGREPIAAWDEFVAKLKADAQYRKIDEEINAEYAKRKGK
ncbi:Lipoprotein LipO precursor [Paenibacillus konkukensis]|uniref:Lipoprotein LipO n=1 Tax=Paenibacillus konkukensis TaxID=2020716 RepID=A0ABY4RN04_9BACL|nr:extracellular solute-binding protein [Paenibacillus konkukensis]UQZ83201.1 Lipoprotein LipO precursor [Paenibacillus konkukensis]